MENIQEQILFTTLRIECLDNNYIPYSVGTGFLLQRPITPEKEKIYLVSNKHVLISAETIRITFTAKTNGEPDIGKTISSNINDVKKHVVSHSNPKVDIAILECTGLFTKWPDN